jgi:hypothetical protein
MTESPRLGLLDLMGDMGGILPEGSRHSSQGARLCPWPE